MLTTPLSELLEHPDEVVRRNAIGVYKRLIKLKRKEQPRTRTTPHKRQK